MLYNRRQRLSAGFTLIEILITIAVIAMLLGLISSGGTVARKKAQVYRAQTMIASLETALAMYHADFGAYPASGNVNLVNLLADKATYDAFADWQGPYMSFKKDDLNGAIPGAALEDPWDNSYNYVNSGTTYTIRSSGPDGMSLTADDITND
ncbi:MAG: type II secretion system protein GspG [Candidatus Omnitrophica bacterium]|nr:type II secretion system protein GspG [Candidatus Omnitrophota bacterium]